MNSVFRITRMARVQKPEERMRSTLDKWLERKMCRKRGRRRSRKSSGISRAWPWRIWNLIRIWKWGWRLGTWRLPRGVPSTAPGIVTMRRVLHHRTPTHLIQRTITCRKTHRLSKPRHQIPERQRPHPTSKIQPQWKPLQEKSQSSEGEAPSPRIGKIIDLVPLKESTGISWHLRKLVIQMLEDKWIWWISLMKLAETKLSKLKII